MSFCCMCHLFKSYTPLHVVAVVSDDGGGISGFVVVAVPVVDVVSGGDGGGDDDGGGISGFVVVAVPGVDVVSGGYLIGFKENNIVLNNNITPSCVH